MLQRRHSRAGFTLVELIVAMAVIAVIAALAALYFPRYQDKEMVARGADQLQGWLLIARQRAMRDGLPTGLWLVDVPLPANRNPNLNQGQNYCIEARYIQQPDNFAQGLYVGSRTASFPGDLAGTTRMIARFSSADLKSLGIKIQSGDYLEIFGSGVLHRIGNPQGAPVPPPPRSDYPVLDPDGSPGTELDIFPDTTPLPNPPVPPPPIGTPGSIDDGSKPNSRTNFRIIAQPRELAGEQKLPFPDNVGIDLNPNNATNPLVDTTSGSSRPMSRNLPVRNNQIEILFGPSGAVIGQGTTSGKIILWVRDLTKPNTGNLLAGSATLITIDPRTGFIAAHPATDGASSGDPYQFTRDARSSGL